MPRKVLIRTETHPYHIYNRVVDKQFYPLNKMPQIWQIFESNLQIATWAYGAKIHAFTLMRNHFHMLITTPDLNISEIMLYIQRQISKEITELTKREIYRFQSRYKWKVIDNELQYANNIKYLFLNPVKAGICELPELYPYSTLSGVMGVSKLSIPICSCKGFEYFSHLENIPNLEWIKKQEE